VTFSVTVKPCCGPPLICDGFQVHLESDDVYFLHT
jgi:hypothetical protein